MLKGSKIVLRTVREKDLDALYALIGDVNGRGEYFPRSLYSETGFKQRFAKDGFWSEEQYSFLICDREDRILGSIWAEKDGYYDGYEIGYILYVADSRGRGYVTEALTMFVEYLFSTLRFNRLKLAILPGNAASKRVAEKCGFKPEGIARGAFFHSGRHTDMEEFSLLRSEFEELSSHNQKKENQ